MNTSLPSEIDSVGREDFTRDHSPPAVVSHSLTPFNLPHPQTNLQQPSSLDCILPPPSTDSSQLVTEPANPPSSDNATTDPSARNTAFHPPPPPTHTVSSNQDMDLHHSASLPSSPTPYDYVDNEDTALTELLRTLTPPPTLGYLPLFSPHHRHDSTSSQSTDVSIHMEQLSSNQDDTFEAEKQPVVDITATSHDQDAQAGLSSIQILPPKALPDSENDEQQNDKLRARPPTTSNHISLDDPRILPSVANTLRQRSNTFPINNRRQQGRARVMSCVARLLLGGKSLDKPACAS